MTGFPFDACRGSFVFNWLHVLSGLQVKQGYNSVWLVWSGAAAPLRIVRNDYTAIVATVYNVSHEVLPWHTHAAAALSH